MPEHVDIAAGEIHVPYQWSYADATARTAATGFVAGDVGKLARQTDDNSLWMLTATTPTWVQVGGPSSINAFDYKASVRVATTAALAAHTRSGNVLTASANGAFPAQDGVTLALNDRILVKNEAASHLEHGIYYLSQLGDASNPWKLTRATDADESSEVTAGMLVPVAEGTTNADTFWLLTTNDTITLNTTALTFTQFGAGGGGGSYPGLTTGGTGSLDFAQGTKTADEPFIDGTVTWNSSGVTFTALKIAVTDTASAAASKLIDLLVGGATVFQVDKFGRVHLPDGTASAGQMAVFFENDNDLGFYRSNPNQLSFICGSVTARLDASTGLTMTAGDGVALNGGSQMFRWVSSTKLLAPTNGQLRIEGNSPGQGDRLIFGEVGATGAMIKRNGTRLEAKLGGDSAYTQFTCEKLGVNNAAAATTPGTVVKKMEVFDSAGTSLGFVAIYDAIT